MAIYKININSPVYIKVANAGGGYFGLPSVLRI